MGRFARVQAVSAAVIVAPTDAQLAYIGKLCAERDLEPPPAVYSKAEASLIIDALMQGRYDVGDWPLGPDVPF